MFSFQGASLSFFFKRLNEISILLGISVNLFIWWRLAGSNRWPPACKAGALPAELNPHISIFHFRCSKIQAYALRFYSLYPRLTSTCTSGPKWSRFSAEKPRRLQQSTGLLLRAAFRVHFGFLDPSDYLTVPYPSRILDSLKWWAKMDSNHRPHDYQSCALASWAIGP